MVIVYHGNVASVKEELARVQPTLHARYVEILGPERARKVEELAQRVLLPSSFFDSLEIIQERLKKPFDSNEPNKMLLFSSSDLTMDVSGKIPPQKVQTTIAFYISETGFEHSGTAEFSESRLASYVHEFDHFIWYALQKVPHYLMKFFVNRHLEFPAPGTRIDGYMGQLMQQDLPLTEKDRRFKLALFHRTLTEMYEASNRVLDKLVLESIGVEVPLPWRGKERSYIHMHNPFREGQVLAIPDGGDMFRNLSDREVIEVALDWENCLKQKMYEPHIQNLIDSTKGLRVSRISLDEMLRLNDRRK